jgi:hypothetical protein
VFGQPAQPSAERTIVFVDGGDTWTWGAVEGAVCEDEAEGWEGFDQASGLELEDFGCDAAAVEAEDGDCMCALSGWLCACVLDAGCFFSSNGCVACIDCRSSR